MKITTLNKVCKIQNGFAFKSKEYLSEGIPLLRISNIVNDRVYFNGSSVFVDEKYLNTKSDFIVEKGDVVIALSGATTGKYGIYELEYPSLLNQRLGLIKSNRSENLDSRYFYYYLGKLKSEIFRKAGGAAQPNISTKELGRFEIPLPPLKTQQKIAAILDEADNLRQLDKKLIKKYEALSQSLFLEMFGDIIKNPKNFQEYKLGNVCDEIFLGLTSKVEYVDNGGYPLIRAKDIRHGELNFNKVKFISKKQHERITKNRITKRGDVLISKSGSLGTCAIVNSDREFTTYESIFTVRVDQVYLTNIFLTELLRNESFKLKLLGNKVGGTVAHLNLKMFRDFIIPVPPISLQKEFALKIQLINEEKLMVKSLARKSNKLFNSLLQKAFKGELV